MKINQTYFVKLKSTYAPQLLRKLNERASIEVKVH